jgi:hypothetical protein
MSMPADFVTSPEARNRSWASQFGEAADGDADEAGGDGQLQPVTDGRDPEQQGGQGQGGHAHDGGSAVEGQEVVGQGLAFLGRPEARHGGFQPAEGSDMDERHDRECDRVTAEVLGRQQAGEDHDGPEADQALDDVGGQIAPDAAPEHQRIAARSPSRTGMVTTMTQRSSHRD